MTKPRILRENREFFLCKAAERSNGVVDVRNFMLGQNSEKYENLNGDEIWIYSIADLLVNEGASPFFLDPQRHCLPIMLAAKAGNWDGFMQLVDAMAVHPNYPIMPDYRNRTILHCAAIGANPQIIAFIVENMLQDSPNLLHRIDDQGLTPLLETCFFARNLDNYEAMSLLLKAGSNLDRIINEEGEAQSLMSYLARLNVSRSLNNLVANISNISFNSQNDCSDLKDVVSDLRNPEIRAHLSKRNNMLAAILVPVGVSDIVEEFNARNALNQDFISFSERDVQTIEELRVIKNRVAQAMEDLRAPDPLTQGEILKVICMVCDKMLDHAQAFNIKPFESREFIDHNYEGLSEVQNQLIKSVLVTMESESRSVTVREANSLSGSRTSQNQLI